MEESHLKVLQQLSKVLNVGVNTIVPFADLSNELNMSKKELDDALNKLEMDRYIEQLVFGNHDEFVLTLRQKGYDTANDIAYD